MKYSKYKLRIADTIIEMRSKFMLMRPNITKPEFQPDFRFKNFIYGGRKKPNIRIDVNIVHKLPETKGAKQLFAVFHFEDNSENWRLFKKGSKYIYFCPLEEKEQFIVINERFDRARAYLLAKNENNYFDEKEKEFIKMHNGMVWSIPEIIYDFLQVLLINYFAIRNQGIFVHSIGVNDRMKRGLLFAGKSGAGKTTLAKMWYKEKNAVVLNDDRTIVRRENGRYILYGTPWHGDFKDYLVSRADPARLNRIFFIYHAAHNTARRVDPKKALSRLYPAIFPTFWDKKCLENIISYCCDLVNSVPSYRLGFRKNRKVIDFVRKL